MRVRMASESVQQKEPEVIKRLDTEQYYCNGRATVPRLPREEMRTLVQDLSVYHLTSIRQWN
jgi:hypothetical protein